MNKKINTWLGLALVAVLAGVVVFLAWPSPKETENNLSTRETVKKNREQVVVRNGSLINKTIGYSFQIPASWKMEFDVPSHVFLDETNPPKNLDNTRKKNGAGESPSDATVVYYKNFSEFEGEDSLTDINDINKDLSSGTSDLAGYINVAKKTNSNMKNITEVDFAGGKAWLTDFEDQMFGGPNALLIAEKNNHIYTIYFWGAKNNLSDGQKQIISSFKFN